MTTHADVHVHHDPPVVVARRDRMGVLLLIVADIAFVLSLMFSYMYLRFLNVNGLWLPEEITPAEASLTWIIVIALFIGTLVFAMGYRSLKSGRRGGYVTSAAIAFVIAVMAAVLQWVQLANFGFPAAENGYFASAYSSTMVVLAGANLFHILLTVVIGLGMLTRGSMGKFAAQNPWQPQLGVFWWSWVTVSAALVALMTTIYVATPYAPSMPSM